MMLTDDVTSMNDTPFWSNDKIGKLLTSLIKLLPITGFIVRFLPNNENYNIATYNLVGPIELI